MEARSFFRLIGTEMVECSRSAVLLERQGIAVSTLSLDFLFRLDRQAKEVTLAQSRDLFLCGERKPIYFRCSVRAERYPKTKEI